MKNFDEIPAIQYVHAIKNKGLIIFWDNGEVRFYDFNRIYKTGLKPKRELLNKIIFDKYSVEFPLYLIDGDPYGIGHDSLYDLCKPIDKYWE